MKSILALLAVLVCAGCSTVNETITAKDGTVTTTKAASFMTKLSGLKRTITSPDGIISSFSLDNYAGDVDFLNAAGNLALQGAKLGLLASGNTNIVTTNSLPRR